MLATYQLPLGAGHRFATGNKVADRIIGGWNISPILSIASGLPLQVYNDEYNETDQVTGNGYAGNGCSAIPLSTMSYSTSPTSNYTGSNGVVGVNGDQNNNGYGVNLFGSNAANVFNNFRPFLVGLDNSCGGGGHSSWPDALEPRSGFDHRTLKINWSEQVSKSTRRPSTCSTIRCLLTHSLAFKIRMILVCSRANTTP